MKKLTRYVVGISLVTIIAALQALACSCPDFGDPLETKVRTELKASDAVFAGEVLNVSDKGRFKSVELNLITLWKGDDLDEKVTILTPRYSSACGIDFTVGEKYLVYAIFGTEYSKEPVLNAWLCSRTRLLSKQQADLPYLGKEKKIGKSSRAP